jgi:HrpA-like RNA helicase
MARYSRSSPEFYHPNQRNRRRQYEGGGVFPQAPDKTELTERLRQLFERRRLADAESTEPYTPAPFTNTELGFRPEDDELELPVRKFKDEILSSVISHQVTIVTAETGAGKSTQIPQYLMERGYHVSMTQPRRIAAQLVSERIAEEIDISLGNEVPYDAKELVGYHTAERNTVGERTRIEVVTDGLRLVQEFGNRNELIGEVLVIDEVHEWNSNIEMLIGRVKMLLKEKPELRVVIMSATMEAEKLSAYFSSATGDKPPVISVPGRNYEVKRSAEPASDVVEQAVKYAQEGENILIFLPGVREITDKMAEVSVRLKEVGVKGAVLLPLHSKLSQQEQDAVKSFYPGPKIIFATNIAQTSITIPDVNVVIDTGLERRTEIDEQAVQGLHLRPASRADMNQRAGRTGRVAPGLYIHTRLDKEYSLIPFSDKERRSDYPIPEILRTNTHSNTLLAASAGIDMKKFDLFHPVDKTVVRKAEDALQQLGAIDEAGQITPRGMRMVRLPMRPEYARMIIEAEDQGFPVAVRQQIAAATSVMEVGGLTSWLEGASRDWRELSEEVDSDFITQLDVFVKARHEPTSALQWLGLDPRAVERANERYDKVVKRIHLSPEDDALVTPSPDERELLKRAVTAGLINHVYQRTNPRNKTYAAVDQTRDTYERKLSGRTTIENTPLLLVGTPYRVEKLMRNPTTIEHVIQDATATTQEALAAVAMESQKGWENKDLRLSEGRLRRVQQQFFRGAINLGVSREIDAEISLETTQFIIAHMMEKSGAALRRLKTIKTETEKLQHLTGTPLKVLTQQEIETLIKVAVESAQSLDVGYIDHLLGEMIRDTGVSLDSYIPKETRDEIRKNAPSQIGFEGSERRLQYNRGVPLMKLESLTEIEEWDKAPRLADGREVKLVYEGRRLYLKTLRQYVRRGKIA